MIKKFYIFLIIVLCWNINLFAKNPPPGTGATNVPANILIMLDNSGSMGWDTNGCPAGRWWCTHNGQVRMVLAKAAIQSLLSQQQLTSSANFGLQQWGSGRFPNNKIRANKIFMIVGFI